MNSIEARPAQTAGTASNYAVYAGGGQSYFKDKVGIGAGALATLHVTDPTPSTGVTEVRVQAGAGQSTNALQTWRNNAGTVLAQLDNDGTVRTPDVISTGTTFTASGCGASTLVGGAVAGKFTVTTAGACSVTVTMGGAEASTNGWACSIGDMTTANLIRETASNATTVTFGGTTANADVLVFGCVGF